MSDIGQLFQRINLAFPEERKRSLKAAIILINIDQLMPASYVYPLPPPSTSEERLDFISFILKKETCLDYSRNEVLAAHNVLMGSNNVREELNSNIGIEKIRAYLAEYKDLQPKSVFAKMFNPLFLLPHRTICRGCQSLLKISLHSCAVAVFCTRIQPCLLYKADCFKCRFSFRVSSIYSMDRRSTIVTPESQKAEFVHFSGSIVLSRQLLVSFSSHLIDGYATFSNFASATMKIIKRLNTNEPNALEPESLGRALQAVWLYYELSNFVFMTSSSTEFSFPLAMCEGRTKVKRAQSCRAAFIERNLDWIYHVFTLFWTHHDEVFGECKSGNCSQVIVLDGHQKP
jgi:hypothetical protein